MRLIRPLTIGLLALILIFAMSNSSGAVDRTASMNSTRQEKSEQQKKMDRGSAGDAELSMRRTALRLAVEENMQVQKCLHTCKGKKSFLTKIDLSASSVVVLVPLNKEILDAAVDYRAALDGIPATEIEQLRQRQYTSYLQGDTCTFVLMIKNDASHPEKCSFKFTEFEANTVLHDEQHSYNLMAYTRLFDSPLSLGWNNGYLYFPNFRECGSKSCSVHFTGYRVLAGANCDEEQITDQEWAFGYDESEIKFLSLLSSNISEDHIRAEYISPQHPSLDLDMDDILPGLLKNPRRSTIVRILQLSA